jgi:hypothetical protein
MSTRLRSLIAAATVLVACAASLAFASAASAPRNGGFETGDFQGWHTFTQFGQGWAVYKHGNDLPGSAPRPAYRRGGGGPSNFYDPAQGKFAAVAPDTGSPRFLFRNLHLRANRKITLSLKVAYKNFADAFYTPHTFDNQGEAKNQQYRIDIIKKGADIDSLAPGDVLKKVFRTDRGDKLKRSWFTVTANLSKFAGQTVTLRLGQTDNQFYFYPGVDAVKLKQTKKKR